MDELLDEVAGLLHSGGIIWRALCRFLPGHTPRGRHYWCGWSVVFSVKERELCHWPLELRCGGLHSCDSDKSIFARVGLNHPGHGPVAGKGVVVLDEDHISREQIVLGSPPLGTSLELLKVFSAPSVPEMLDHGLAFCPALGILRDVSLRIGS